jgi:hypothetical protein
MAKYYINLNIFNIVTETRDKYYNLDFNLNLIN